MSLEHVVRPAADEPAGALILLHGRGTNEYDLAPLADVLDPERRLLAVTPRAPLVLPPGGTRALFPSFRMLSRLLFDRTNGLLAP